MDEEFTRMESSFVGFTQLEGIAWFMLWFTLCMLRYPTTVLEVLPLSYVNPKKLKCDRLFLLYQYL